MKKGYQSPKAEKVAFKYTESVVASNGFCESTVTKQYKDSGVRDCDVTYVGVVTIWNGDNLGG